MKIPTNVHKRLKKTVSLKPDLQTPFVQGDHEYLTNTYFMIKTPKQENQKEDDRQLPIMKVAEENATPKEKKTTRLDVQYLIDTLEILKSNGAKIVDMQCGEHAISLTGLDSPFSERNKVKMSALLMVISNKN